MMTYGKKKLKMEDDFEKIRQNLLRAQELRKKYTPNGNLPQIYFHHHEMGTLRDH